MALSADSARLGATTNRALNKLAFALANEASDITTATTSDRIPMVDASADYAVKYADGDNVLEMIGITSSAAELNITDGVTATAAEINKLDDSVVVIAAGAGVSAAETYKSGYFQNGGIITTRIFVDLTGLVGSATDLDIIGNTGGAASAHFGQITVAKSGTLVGGKVTCLEVPAGGSTDVDFYSATVSTGAQDVDVTTLTETVLVTSGGAWTSGASKGMTALPPANDFLYIVNGAASAGTFSAGKFMIELYGA